MSLGEAALVGEWVHIPGVTGTKWCTLLVEGLREWPWVGNVLTYSEGFTSGM